MDQHDLVAERFEAKRSHLRGVAYRMLGSLSEADDAVQEAWLRLHRTDASTVENLGGWLTTVVARVCLDMLRSRKSRGEEPLDPLQKGEDRPEAAIGAGLGSAPGTRAGAGAGASAGLGSGESGSLAAGIDPERDTLLADSVGVALLVVLDTLAPAERVAFVLHDMFDLSFDEIAPIVGRSPVAARQLASRARRRMQGASAGSSADDDVDRAESRDASDDSARAERAEMGDAADHRDRADRRTRRREIVDAFLTAARGGDLTGLLALLDPNVVLTADRTTPLTGETGVVRGQQAVTKAFSGSARAAQPALIDGAPGLVWAQAGVPGCAFVFTIDGDRVTAIELVLDPERLSQMDLVFGRKLLDLNKSV